MADYRLFFLGSDGAIEARQDFTAADDNSALQIMRVIADASADTHHGVMLWQGSRRIFEIGEAVPDASDHAASAKADGARHRITAANLAHEHQQCVLDCELALLDSHWRLAKSRMLIEATSALRLAIAPPSRGAEG